MLGLYEKVKNMTPEERKRFIEQHMQKYHQVVEHIEDPNLARALNKAAEVILKNQQEQ